MLDLSYDVNVKFVALGLLVMAVCLLVPDLSRFYESLPALQASCASGSITCTSVAMDDYDAPCGEVRMNRIRAVLRYQGDFDCRRPTRRERAPQPPVHGLYEVEEFKRRDHVVEPITGEASRWRKVVFDSRMSIELMDESAQFFATRLTSHPKSVNLSKPGEKDFLVLF